MKPERMTMRSISAGMKGILTEFEKEVRAHEFMGAEDPESWPIIEANYDAARQKLLRKLKRLENGTDIGHIEQVKRDFRKLAAAYIELATTGKDNHDIWVMAQQVVQHKRRL